MVISATNRRYHDSTQKRRGFTGYLAIVSYTAPYAVSYITTKPISSPSIATYRLVVPTFLLVGGFIFVTRLLVHFRQYCYWRANVTLILYVSGRFVGYAAPLPTLYLVQRSHWD